VGAVYNVFSSTVRTPEFQEVEMEMSPRLAAHRDKIVQNARLFERIAAVYEGPERAKLDTEQQRLVWDKYTDFVRTGARLDAGAKKKLGDINQRLATLYTQFSQNVLADEGRYVLVEREADLDGLPEAQAASAAAEAASRGHEGRWAILNTRSSVEPFLSYAANRALREKVWREFVQRGDNGDKNDNKAVIGEIVRLRHERAKLLGYPTHAHWRLEKSMARSPERALELMQALWKPALARAKEEIADMQALADKLGHGIAIEPWDYRFYAEKVRAERYQIDNDEVAPYLQLDKLREGMFWVAGELLGLAFEEVRGVPVVHPDIRVWDVSRGGKHVGLFYFDPYARPHKESGAWMNAYRDQQRFDGEVTTLVSNNCNYMKPAPGKPVLVSWDDAVTLFHEFGHGLHGLASDVRYPSLAGTNVDRDYVEFPSQLLESWLPTREVLNRFARHCRTGEPMPEALVKKIEAASKFNKGFDNVEYLSSALLDMRLHLEPGRASDIDAFEREALAAIGMPREIVMRHRLPHFGHLFSGDSYSAGYYSYLWADTLSADAFEAFTEAAGPYDKKVASRLLENVFAAGNTRDPEEGYRAFRGRDAGIEALMRKRGFARETSLPLGGGPGRG
jgi:peptidyl-dipeptidase Dcp